MKLASECILASFRALLIVFFTAIALSYPVVAEEIDVFDLIADADSAFADGDLDRALGLYQKVEARESDNVYALNKIALIQIKKNDAPAARRTYEKLIKVAPHDTTAHYWLGILALRDNDVELAYKEFAGIVENAPNDSNAAYAHMFLGAIYTFRHQPQQAILSLKRARISADKADVHYKLARAYYDADMPFNAHIEYLRTLEMDPTNLFALDGLGWVHYNRGERGKAIEIWKRGLELSDGKFSDIRDNLAKAYNDEAMTHYQANDIPAARDAWQSVLTYDSQNKAALHFLAKTR